MALVFMLGATTATWFKQHYHPVEWTVENIDFKAYLDDVEWLNETKLNFGTVNASESYYTLNVTNTGNVAFTVYFIVQDLPPNHTLVWAGNDTVLLPTESVQGDLTLTIGATVTPGTYNCKSWIRGEQT